MRPNHVQGRIHLQKLRFLEIWPQDGEKDNSPKWTRGSHTWTLTPNRLLGTFTAPIPPFHFTLPGRILPSLCGPIPNVIAPPPLQHNPHTSPPLLPLYVRTSSMFKRTAALPHTFVKRPPLILWKRMHSLIKIWQATTSPTRKIPLLPFKSCSRLLTRIQGLPKHYAALTHRHLITCLIANHVQGNNTPHPGTVLSSFSSISRSSSCLLSPPMIAITHRPFFSTRKFTTLNSGTHTWTMLVTDSPPLMALTKCQAIKSATGLGDLWNVCAGYPPRGFSAAGPWRLTVK